MNAATIDGVLRREGDVWTTTDPRHGTTTHTLKVATGDERVPEDCVVCAQGLCVIEGVPAERFVRTDLAVGITEADAERAAAALGAP